MRTVIKEDPRECRHLWESLWPAKGVFDLWQVRDCFHEAFLRPLRFHVVEENGIATGFLPLCWNGEMDNFIQFPGETWHGRTWIEQNRIVAQRPDVLRALLDSLEEPVEMRYLIEMPLENFSDLATEDEIGYLFYPGLCDFNLDNYWLSFSGKSKKKINAELKKINSFKVAFRFNQRKDLDHLFRMSIDAFGSDSYFSDSRFYHGFENLAGYLEKMGMLRITTVLIGNRVAAVDMGALWKNSYTVLAGGTNPDFPGIAKLINLHHLDWACNQRLGMVDFLCGDFNWKTRFHLTPRPLYKINIGKSTAVQEGNGHGSEALCA